VVSIALLTVSDTRNTKNDESGNYLLHEAERSGHNVVDKIICKDDIYLIRKINLSCLSNMRLYNRLIVSLI